MNSYAKFYEKNLYPFQDGILKIVKELNLPFYLTGGTALSRVFFQHRYSDDLDLFVNADQNYKNYIRQFISALQVEHRRGVFSFNTDRLITSDDYTQILLTKNEVILKIDLVNDIDVHFGEIVSNSCLGKIDSLRNILSNKISALFRYEIKDYVDIWVIANNARFNWREILSEAKQKEAAVDSVEIFNLFKSFPFDNLKLIKWIRKYNKRKIEKDFNTIAEDIFYGQENSLCVK
jgi:predicted nucleotidyltransferase component of viral defense system